MQTPSVYENPGNKSIIVVGSEIDAILLQQCAGDLCCPIALGGSSKRLDSIVYKLLMNAPAIIFSFVVDSAGVKVLHWWKDVYPSIKLWLPPIGKSPGDAFLAGINLRGWVGMAFLE